MVEFINAMLVHNPLLALVIYCLLSLMPFAILGYLFSKHLDRKPSFLISFDRMKDLENAWTLLLVITAPLVFIYNVFVWAAWSFVIIANFIAAILKKLYDYLISPILKVIKWILNSFVWLFINILWIPISIIFKLLYHYIILWSWDLYISSFHSLKNTFNKAKIKVGFIGAFYSLVIMGIGVYMSILLENIIFVAAGIIIGLLPVLQAYGTITSMLHFDDDHNHILHGKKVMRTSLNYILISLSAIIAIHLLLFMSFIPDFGLILLGIAVNANVILSGIVILTLFVLLFADSLIPNYLLYNDESTKVKESLLNYLHSIKEKGVQLILSIIPGILWSSIVLIIPVLFLYLTITFADSAKTRMLQNRGDKINQKIIEQDSKIAANYGEHIEELLKSSIKLEMQVMQNNFSLGYPNNVIVNPEIIFDSNKNSYTDLLPERLKQAIDDTVSVGNSIMMQEAELIAFQKYFNQYKYENWHFIIERRISNSRIKDWRVVSVEEDITEYVDSDVEEGRSYEYRLKAVNSNGSSNWSPIFRRTIGKTAVYAPSKLRVSRERNFRHILKWNDNSYNEEGFSIQRKESKESKWKTLSTVAADQTIYIDTDISTGTTYDYRVFAIGMNSKTNPTRTVRLTSRLTLPYSLTAIANLKSILLNWEYNFRYSQERNKGRGTPNKLITVFSHKKTSFSEDLQLEIDNKKGLIERSKEQLIASKEIVSIYTSLVDYEESMRYQYKIFKNFSFLFALLFIAIFLGVILSILISYVSSLFYNAYKIRDNQPWYFMSLVREVRSKNKNQPLLGFTLFPLLFLFCFGGSALLVNIPENVIDLDFKFNNPTLKEIVEDEKTTSINSFEQSINTTLDYKFDLGERNQHDNYFILLSSFQTEEAAKELVDSLLGYSAQYAFLPDVSNSQEKSYLVYLGPYFPEEEANQWVKTFAMEPPPTMNPLPNIIKTIKVSDSDNKEEIDQEYQDFDSVTFKVQIGVYKQGSKLHDQEFKDVNAKEEVVNGTYKYFVGATSDTTIVSHLKEEMIKKGFTDAFIVAYKDGVRIKYSVQ